MPYIYKIHAMAEGSRSSLAEQTAQSAPKWLRWAMPSTADLIFVALLCALVFTPLSTRLLGDAGIGWHIRTGQLILTTHEVPRADPFSTQIQKPWIAWEWLYDVAVGEFNSRCGLNGVVWLTALVIAVVFAGTFRLLQARATSLLVSLILVLLAIAASMIHFLARPHVISWLFVVVWFWVLDSTERDSFVGRRSGAWRVWILPLSMLVWVNLHGGFLLGFVLLGIFWVSSLWTWVASKENRIEESFRRIAAGKRTRKLIWVGFSSGAATLVNPYGWHLHEHVYSYLSNRFLMDHIQEFQSPNFHGIAERCFLGLLLIAMAAIAARGRNLRTSEILLMLFAVYAGLYAARNIPVASILLVLVSGPLLPAIDFSGFFHEMNAVNSMLRGHLWPLIAFILTLLIAVSGGRVGSSQWMDANFDSKRMPVAAVDFLQKNEINSPVLSPDYWGGYLIYRLNPQNKVVIDDRHDFYGEEFLKPYLKMIHVEPGWDDFLAQHAVSVAMLPTKSALAVMMGQNAGWKVVFNDSVATIFVRPDHGDTDKTRRR